MNCYLGVDPGKKGGICILGDDREVKEYCVMPPTKKDIAVKIAGWIELYPDTRIICERAQTMPKQGITSAFNYGNHFGTFEDAGVWLEIPYIEVRPAEWKKALGLNSDKVNSNMMCKRMFPYVNLIPPGCRTEYDGISEAVLIAEWARRQNL
jgi:hypothetical protein